MSPFPALDREAFALAHDEKKDLIQHVESRFVRHVIELERSYYAGCMITNSILPRAYIQTILRSHKFNASELAAYIDAMNTYVLQRMIQVERDGVASAQDYLRAEDVKYLSRLLAVCVQEA